MTDLELILTLSLAFSAVANIVLFVYTRTVISKLLSIADELFDLREMSDSLANHLKSVYDLEMFYGDETLGSLMAHARSFVEQLQTFEEIFNLIEEEQTEYEQTENENTDTDAEEA
jgi:cell shape-determining protein MreC